MHEDETILCPFPERKYEVLRLTILCKVRVGPHGEIRRIAQSFEKQAGLSAKDAIHLACASYVSADAFLTCDDSLIRQAKQLNLKMVVTNPVDYISRRTLTKLA
jgi:predicted nucleic acid-binding protein